MSSDKDRRSSDDEGSRKRPHLQKPFFSTNMTSMLIEIPAENDVLFGRGAPIIRWQGNVRFRELVRQRKAEYLATRRHSHKDTIAREIIEEIETNRRGRFLKRALTNDSNSEDDFLTGIPRQWTLAESELVIEKVKQALRDKEIDSNNRKISTVKKRQAEEEAKVFSRVEKEPSSDGSAQQTRLPDRQPVALLPLPNDNQSLLLAELQRHLQAQTTQHQRGWTDPIHVEQRDLLGGMASGQLPTTSAPFNPPANDALMYSELMRQHSSLQRMLVPDPPRMQHQHPQSVNPMEAAIAWLRARQDAEAREIQHQSMQRAIQEAIRWLAVPTVAGAITQMPQPVQDRDISTRASSSGNEGEIQGRASPHQEQNEEESSSVESQP